MPQYKEDQLIAEAYQEVTEAMGRRDFLRMMGKGAAVAAAPKGAIMNVLGSMPVSNLESEIIKGLNVFYPMGTTSYGGSNIWKTLEGIRNFFITVPAILKGKNIQLPSKLQSEVSKYAQFFNLNRIKNDMKEKGIDDVLDYLEYEQPNDIFAFDDVLGILYDNNLVSAALSKEILKHTGMHWYELSDSPKARAFREKETKRRGEEQLHKQYAKNINYARSDYAGGSEDEGYAKYYESVDKQKYNNKQLKMGIKAELSDKHTKSKKKAEKIAKDHLKEDPKYYSKLKKCKL